MNSGADAADQIAKPGEQAEILDDPLIAKGRPQKGHPS